MDKNYLSMSFFMVKSLCQDLFIYLFILILVYSVIFVRLLITIYLIPEFVGVARFGF